MNKRRKEKKNATAHICQMAISVLKAGRTRGLVIYLILQHFASANKLLIIFHDF